MSGEQAKELLRSNSLFTEPIFDEFNQGYSAVASSSDIQPVDQANRLQFFQQDETYSKQHLLHVSQLQEVVEEDTGGMISRQELHEERE